MTKAEKARDLLAMIEIKEPNELFVNSWWGSFVNDYKEALQIAIKALEQNPCEDCISRQEAINCATLNEFRYKIVEDIKALPSVTPKEKTGHWIDDGQYAEGHSEHAYRCSKCDETYIGYTEKYKYCPNCGYRMRGDSNGNE